jgi:hypothetical protein
MAYAGFDRADCPDLSLMARLRAETNLVWCGYYLRAPSQAAVTWRGKRSTLIIQGWGLAPIYVGQETVGPGSHIVTAPQGTIDGAEAVSDMVNEGFPSGSWVYLDLENGPPFGNMQSGYVESWAASVEAGGYRAGIYCSFLFARQIKTLLPQARIWVYHVVTVAPHPVDGTQLLAPEPATSGFAGATIWQHQDEARLTAFGDMACDLDSSVYADPSAPESPIASSVAPPQTSPGLPVGAKITTVAQLQTALNRLGAVPPLIVDNDFGLASQAALMAFQKKAGLDPDGIFGSLTEAALMKALG